MNNCDDCFFCYTKGLSKFCALSDELCQEERKSHFLFFNHCGPTARSFVKKSKPINNFPVSTIVIESLWPWGSGYKEYHQNKPL